MKKYILLLLLLSCTQEEKEKPYIFGDESRGWTVSYKHRTLWSDDSADTTQMKVEILKR